jgi:hypothetical protein
VNLGANVLYLNDGHGNFSDMTAAAGVAGVGPGQGVNIGDVVSQDNPLVCADCVHACVCAVFRTRMVHWTSSSPTGEKKSFFS